MAVGADLSCPPPIYRPTADLSAYRRFIGLPTSAHRRFIGPSATTCKQAHPLLSSSHHSPTQCLRECDLKQRGELPCPNAYQAMTTVNQDSILSPSVRSNIA